MMNISYFISDFINSMKKKFNIPIEIETLSKTIKLSNYKTRGLIIFIDKDNLDVYKQGDENSFLNLNNYQPEQFTTQQQSCVSIYSYNNEILRNFMNQLSSYLNMSSPDYKITENPDFIKYNFAISTNPLLCIDKNNFDIYVADSEKPVANLNSSDAINNISTFVSGDNGVTFETYSLTYHQPMWRTRK